VLTTVILWIVLTVLIILLIIIASPIRIFCEAAYRDGGGTNFNILAHYLHPLIIRMEYSSEDGQKNWFILGFKKKKRGGGQEGVGVNGVVDDDVSDVGVDSVDSVDRKDVHTGNVGTDNVNNVKADNVSTNSVSTDNVSADNVSTDHISTDNVNTDNISTDNTSTDDTNTKKKKNSLLSRIKSKINDIKRSRVYKIISNKPLRNKLLRWLKSSIVRLIRIVPLKNLKLHAKIGVNDPAELGKICGYFYAARSVLTLRNYNVDMSMEPIFTEKRLDIDSELKIRTTISIIIWHLAAILATFPYLRVRKAWRRTK